MNSFLLGPKFTKIFPERIRDYLETALSNLEALFEEHGGPPAPKGKRGGKQGAKKDLPGKDAPHPYQITFQDPATPSMEGIVDLHHEIMFYVIVIIAFVL